MSQRDAEKLLVKHCLEGRDSAWDELLRLHYRLIASVTAWQKWHFDPDEQADVRQEILEQIVRSLKTFEHNAALSTFIHRIAVHTCIARIRNKRAAKRINEADCVSLESGNPGSDDRHESLLLSPDVNQEDRLAQQELTERLKTALARLDERCRELVRMRFFEDLPFDEIADALKAKVNTLTVALRRCMDRLRGQIRAGV